jgi:glutamyl-tRNA reductase
MGNIFLLGLNHKTAPVELRECIAFDAQATDTTLELLKQAPSISEILLYSTCNRVEVLFVAEDKQAAVAKVKDYISEINNLPLKRFEQALYLYENSDAVRHLFRVAASLDSMIVGEPQILGQIKEAYQAATTQHTSGVILNRLLHRAFFVAKRVRSETGIGDNAVSISYAAIELGRKIFDTLENKRVLLIGAGEMAEIAVEHLVRNRVGNIYVANRTFERGVALAKKFNGQAIRMEELAAFVQQVDIIISSTGAPEFVLRREQVKELMRSRRNRPVFFIDIAVPRDIDPAINRLPNCYVYDIDDLKNVIEDNIEDRQREAIKGERIVDEAVIRFQEWLASLDVVPTIVALRNKLDTIAQGELKKTLGSLSLAGDEQAAIVRMTNALVKKILHDPTLLLKRDGCRGNRSVHLDLVRKLFNLDE